MLAPGDPPVDPTALNFKRIVCGVDFSPMSVAAFLTAAELARSMNAEAVAVLLPVSNSPHRSSSTRRAREMIATAKAAMGQAVEVVEAPPEEADDGA